MNEYKLTLVTTTYNHGKYIEQCLKSILNQKTNFKYKLLVSDDGSTDNTRDILKVYQEKYPEKLEVIYNKKNLGAMGNFVYTLNMVHTEYVALCDGDDYWTDKNKLQKQVDFLDNNKEYAICFHQTLIFFEDNSRNSALHPLNLPDKLTLNDLIKENFIPANTVVYRWKYKEKDSLKTEFPENIVPGDYFIHLMHANVGKIFFINKPMSAYRRQENGMWYLTTQPDKEDEFYLKYGEKYFNFFEQVEIKLDKPEIYKFQKDYILKKTIQCYVKNRKKTDMLRLYNNKYSKYQEIFDLAIMDLTRKNKIYYYYCLGNKKLFLKTIKHIKYKLIKKV